MDKNKRVLIIAELGVNHNGSPEIAKELIDAAAAAGADAVKFQTFRAGSLTTPEAPKAAYQAAAAGPEESQLDMLARLELSYPAHILLKEYCSRKGVQFLSSPFDADSLDFLVKELQLSVIKLASGELTNAPLLLRAAQTGVELLLSTGMSALGEIEEALGVLAYGYLPEADKRPVPSIEAFKEAYRSPAGQLQLEQKVTLLHCTTEYPAAFEEVNLKALDTLRQCFGLRTGYSDHTPGIAVPLAAAALGAELLEKHLTLDRSMEGPDHPASLEPEEFFRMVQGIRQIEKALGTGKKIPVPSEWKNMRVARKGIVAARPIREGERFTPENLTVKRPENGLPPLRFWELCGKPAPRAYGENEAIL